MSSALSSLRLAELLSYDRDTGAFTWVRSKGRQRAGGPAGTVRASNGYIAISIDGRIYYAHRLAWLSVHGVWPTHQVDHLNGVRTDNRIENLRDASPQVNSQNQRRAKSDNKCGWLGVRHQPSTGRYVASIKVGGKVVRIGVFDCPDAAHQAYVARKRVVHEGNTL